MKFVLLIRLIRVDIPQLFLCVFRPGSVHRSHSLQFEDRVGAEAAAAAGHHRVHVGGHCENIIQYVEYPLNGTLTFIV